MKLRRPPSDSEASETQVTSEASGVGKSQRLFQLDDTLFCVCLHRHDRNAEFFGKFRRIKPQSGFFRDIHHVEREHAGQAKLDDLQGKLEVALQVGGVDHADDEVGFLLAGEQAAERVERDFFIRRIRTQRVTAGQIEHPQLAAVRREGFAGFHLHRDAGVVADTLVRPGQRVEKRGFPGVGIADQCDRRGSIRTVRHDQSAHG